jgi:acyl-CoA synthetase (AMP-forming)/AMP-acid ligase II/thioesterase domain-containing protein/acyl carrier protein
LAHTATHPPELCPGDRGIPLSSESIHELLQMRASSHPQRTAIVAPGREPLTYGRLLLEVERMAAALASSGIRTDDRVAVVLPAGLEMAMSFLAVAITAACAPLNPALRAHEFDLCLSDLRPKALIVEAGVDSPVRSVAAKYGATVIELLSGREAGVSLTSLEMSRERPRVFREGSDVAFLLPTSGTTSRPKLVPLTHANVCQSADNITTALGLTPEDRCLNFMPLFHGHGLIGSVLSSIWSGSSVVCGPAFHASKFFQSLSEFRPTWYTAVPTMHAEILNHIKHDSAVVRDHSLRFVRSCSASLSLRVMNELERSFDVPVIEAYGMTEASHQITSNPLPPRKRKPGSAGLPFGTSVAIMDEFGQLLGPGQTGEIVIRGRNVTAGYAGDPVVNGSAFAGNWFRTGDVGLMDDEGYLFIKGRTKEIINRGGEKISPREIEQVLLEHPEVEDAIAFAVPDEKLQEEVGAAVVRKATHTTEAELQKFASTRLADFKVPRRVIFVAEIPKNPVGKPQRIGMATRLGLNGVNSSGSEESVPFAAARTQMEELLSAMWLQILGLQRVGIYDNFFALGGDSLAAMQTLLGIEHVTGLKLPINSLFEAPTIEQLATLITGGSPSSQQLRVVPIQGKGWRAPFFCIDAGPLFWDLAQRLGYDQPFLGLLTPEAPELPEACGLEDIAKVHVRSIRAVQPDGPYFLGGWCTSGVVAYEVAQQLHAQGQEVGLLALFDSVNPAGLQRLSKVEAHFARLYNRAEKIRFHLKMLRQQDWQEAPAYCKDRMETIRRRLKRAFWRLGYKVRWHRNRTQRDAEEIQRWAVSRYSPQPYAGRALLFRRSLRPLGRYLDAALGWRQVMCGSFDVCEIPGNHEEMFLEPSVQTTAEKLIASLNSLQVDTPIRTECMAGALNVSLPSKFQPDAT